MKQKGLSVWLRAVLCFGGLFILFLALELIPRLGQHVVLENPNLAPAYLPCLIFFWVTTIPVYAFIALVWLIAVEIGRDNSFCHENARRLSICGNLALADTVLYLAAGCVLGFMHLLHITLLIAGIVICSIGVAVAVCCAALSHLTRKAADMQSENDLTV